MTTPAIPTRAQARARRREEERGFLFPLHKTGGVAHVRPMPVASIALADGLPVRAQQTVLRVFRELEGEGVKPSALTWDAVAKNQKRQLDVADAMCVACFVAPRLVYDEAEIDPDDETTMLVTDLHPEERVRFLTLCTGTADEEVRRLEPFPETGLGGAAPAPAGPTAQPAIRLAETA